jgi:hypothetical protein
MIKITAVTKLKLNKSSVSKLTDAGMSSIQGGGITVTTIYAKSFLTNCKSCAGAPGTNNCGSQL